MEDCASERTFRSSRHRLFLQRPVDKMHPSREPFRQFDAVRYTNQHHVLGRAEFKQCLTDLVRTLPIQVAGRFVCQHEGRSIDESAADGNALTFAAGELGRSMRESLGQSNMTQKFLRAGGQVFLNRSMRQGREQDILQHRALREQMMILKDEADVIVAKPRLLGF